jgi:quercetin dioxygenase-like cupin family protein
MERATVEAGERGRQSLFEGEPRTVLLTLAADERVPAHSHPDRAVVFHVLDGEIELTLDDETTTLQAGELARFGGDCDISPYAPTESRALVILAKR